MEPLSFLIMCVVSFCAVIIGTLVGMAMLILPPTMIFLGVPPHMAIATSRFSLLGNGIGNMARFSKRTTIESQYILPFAISGIICSALGAYLLKAIPEEWLLKGIGIMMILLSIVVWFEDAIKKFHIHQQITWKNHLIAVVAGIIIGSYLGVMGGGAATLIIFVLVLAYGLDFHRALAHQKFITFPIAALTSVIFITQGMIDYSIAIPLLIVNILGGWVGAHFVLKANTQSIKKILIPVTLGLALFLLFK